MSQSGTYTMDTTEASSPTLSRDFKVISNYSLDFGGRHCLPLGTHLIRSPSMLDLRTGGSQQKLTAHFPIVVYPNSNLKYATMQGSPVSCLAQTGFAAFGKGAHLISGPPYAETKQFSRLTSPSGILTTS